MRLLKTVPPDNGGFEILEFRDHDVPPYAILSHTWGDKEVTLEEVNELGAKSKAGYAKIKQCCAIARAAGLDYVWIDTCCIDKTSSAELSEAINSMYRWYEEAEVCYIYLADVPSKKSFQESRWFTRGWTLQELVSPSTLVFYDEAWVELKDDDIQRRVADCTGIPLSILRRESDIDEFSIAQRMSWAAKRETTRVEDRAYSLMGLFGVNMPLIYGERETAFMRLQEEIMRISDDHSLFAWESTNNDGLLATSPSAFLLCKDTVPCSPFKARVSPLTVSSRGIHLEVRFIGIGMRGLGMALLHCKKAGEEDDKFIAILVRDKDLTMEQFKRVRPEETRFVSLKDWRPSQYPVRKICIQARRTTRMRKVKPARSNSFNQSEEYSQQKISRIMQFENPYALCDTAEMGKEDDVWLLLTRSDIWVDTLSGTKVYSKMIHKEQEIVDNLSGQTPLSLAAGLGHLSTVRLLLQRGAAVDSKDDLGQTPLSLAAQFGHTATTQLLLNMGAALESTDKFDMTALMYAAANGHKDTVNVLLDIGATVDSRGTSGMTALMYAAANGHKDTLDVLLCKGAAIDVADEHGQTALTYAAINGNENAATALILHGSDINVRNESGRTPLSLAAGSGFESVVKSIISKGGEIDASDKFGRTPLWWAAGCSKNTTIIKTLLENGASASAKAESGEKPVDIAYSTGNKDAYKLLRLGAKNRLHDQRPTKIHRFFNI
jgi:ankyrin repeat protein